LNLFPGETDKLRLPALFSVGLHPWHVHAHSWKSQVENVKSIVSGNRVIAIGEAGLDKAAGNPYEFQKSAFAEQLAVAESEKKPVIIHCVRSYSELLAYRKRSDQSVPWIFHWFNADEQTAGELIRKNCYLSFGHMLFRGQSKAFGVFSSVSLDRVFFETDDAGYTIREIYARAGMLRNVKETDLKNQIMDNFNRCFQL
jgi:TatD DNase family protein